MEISAINQTCPSIYQKTEQLVDPIFSRAIEIECSHTHIQENR